MSCAKQEREKEEDDEDALGDDDEEASQQKRCRVCDALRATHSQIQHRQFGWVWFGQCCSQKEAAKSKKAAKAAEGGDSELMDTGDGETMSEEDFLNMIESRKDVKMKQIFQGAGQPAHACLQALFPDVVLIQKMKVGHQIKGVP